MNYNLAYAIGFQPWEDAASDPPFVAKISEILDREENGREPPYGTALDLGTGSGIWGGRARQTRLAGHPRGHRGEGPAAARERIEKEGVEIRVVHADLTTLRDAGVGEDFRLLGVADAASARYGWPLHAIEHCGVDPHVEQPDAFLDALRAELDGGSPVRKRKRS